MAGVDLRTVAKPMGHSSIQMTMRYAHLAPQYNRAAADRLVSVAKPNRATKKGAGAVRDESELVTKSVSIRKLISATSTESQNKYFNNNSLQEVAP